MNIERNELTDGKLAMWDANDPEETVLIYTPPRDKTKRYYNSP